MEFYKHAISVTAQVYFCAAPIRLDSYNKCQFGCTYCFSRSRSINNALKGLREANTEALAKRLDRVAIGVTKSSLDEFLENRVPIQLGGLQDPFSPMEDRRQVTRRALHVLQRHHYPTIISTKGDLCIRPDYLDLLSAMNVYVRVSAAGVAEKYREKIDYRCSSFEQTLDRIRVLSNVSIPVSLRIQPVIPGFEEQSLEMAEKAISAGARHVSFEYLKFATEGLQQTAKRITAAVGNNVWENMQRMGVKRLGRDYTLLPIAKSDFLIRAKKLCSQLGAKFGAGDTEFIPHSDGGGCCSGAGFFLKSANEFRANFGGVVSQNLSKGVVRFQDLRSEWGPQKTVHTYLTTNSRGRDQSGQYSDWLALLAHRWNAENGPYSPHFFEGVSWDGQYDEKGLKIYTVQNVL